MKRFAILMLFLSFNANAADFLLGSDVGIYVGAQKVTEDHELVQLGVTVEWKYVALDFSHGIRRVAWRVKSEPQWEMDKWQSGSVFSIRGYPFDTRPIRPLITWVHMSDIFRGCPFNKNKQEPTSDYFGLGATIDWKKIEIDLSFGVSARECSLFQCDSVSFTNEAQIQFRGYIWGKQ